MLFSDEFVESIKHNPVGKAIEICNLALEKLEDNTRDWTDEEFAALAEAYSLLVEILSAGLIQLNINQPEIDGSRANDCSAMRQFLFDSREMCLAAASKLKVESMRKRFRVSLDNGFSYEFSQGDLDRIQLLLSQLRDLIANSKNFDKDHQYRLLQRLEKLQSEMHKKVSDLDRFWGLIGDASVVLGKIGKEAKPIVDRVREITEIVWQTQSRAEELPSGTPLPSLEHKPSGDGV